MILSLILITFLIYVFCGMGIAMVFPLMLTVFIAKIVITQQEGKKKQNK